MTLRLLLESIQKNSLLLFEAHVRDPAKQYPLRMIAQQFQANKTVKVNNAAQLKQSLSPSVSHS